MSETCSGCGSAVAGRVCHYCGTIVRMLESPSSEAEAIAELHAAITSASEDAVRARLLKNGPLPADRDVLVDAGLRAAQLLDPSTYADETPKAAITRVEAVVMKLRVVAGNDGVAQRAIQELEQCIKRYRQGVIEESKQGSRAVLVLLAIVVLVVGGIIALVTWLLR